MILTRVFNNNIGMATSDSGEEIIVTGRGLCFGLHAGETLNSAKIDKTYTLQADTLNDSSALNRLEKLISSIPEVDLIIAEEIVEMLRQEPNMNVDDNILMALADHISLAIEREKKGIPCENPLLAEIQQFYKYEYSLAKRAAKIIHKYAGIWISDEERGFITLHIVNATMQQRADRLIISVQIVKDVLAIISQAYETDLDPNSLSYERLVRHLQFFAQRALDPNVGQINTEFHFKLTEVEYPKAIAPAMPTQKIIERLLMINIKD